MAAAYGDRLSGDLLVSTDHRRLRGFIAFQVVLDGAVGAVLVAAPGVLGRLPLLPTVPDGWVRGLGGVALVLAVCYGLALWRLSKASGPLLVANVVRAVTGSTMLVFLLPDDSLVLPVRLAGTGELLFAAITIALQRRAGLALRPGRSP
jgi:hypothetical protein